jgi:hypothetical protein
MNAIAMLLLQAFAPIVITGTVLRLAIVVLRSVVGE